MTEIEELKEQIAKLRGRLLVLEEASQIKAPIQSEQYRGNGVIYHYIPSLPSIVFC